MKITSNLARNITYVELSDKYQASFLRKCTSSFFSLDIAMYILMMPVNQNLFSFKEIILEYCIFEIFLF